jgi:acetyltransferase-like isoleucine patch superfamily enzyme
LNGSKVDDLRRQLREMYDALRAEMRVRWRRDLPFEELLFDRWERARSLGFGEGSSIYHHSYVYGDVRVGAQTWIGPLTLLDGTGGLTIGSHCSISAGVQIYTHDTVRWALSGGQAKYEYAPVVIGDCCYIGSRTIIAKGVRIGPHSVVGAGSFVNRDVPPYVVAFGVPCRPAGRVQIDAAGEVAVVLDTPRVARRGNRKRNR